MMQLMAVHGLTEAVYMESCNARLSNAYMKLMAEAAEHGFEEDWRRAARTYREAIALEPDEPLAYLDLGAMLASSGHKVEAAQRYLEAKERFTAGSGIWAEATARAFDMLRLKECDEVAKPEWWDYEGLEALSARVVRAAPNEFSAHTMRAVVLSGGCGAWKAPSEVTGAELKEAATHFERAAAMCPTPAVKADYARSAVVCRSWVRKDGGEAQQQNRELTERQARRAGGYDLHPVSGTCGLKGHRVRICGLKGRPELNGRCGVAGRFDAAKGRYEVAVEGDAEAVLLKPANLQELFDPAPSTLTLSLT